MAPKLLVLGPLGPPHVEDQALAMSDRGFDVEVGGNALAGLEETALWAPGCRSTVACRPSRHTVGHYADRIVGEAPDRCGSTGRRSGALAAGLRVRRCASRRQAAGGDRVGLRRASCLASDARRLAFALRRADLVMADSQDLLDGCVRLGASRDRVEIVHWGVDLTKFRPRTEDERSALKVSFGLGPGPVISALGR